MCLETTGACWGHATPSVGCVKASNGGGGGGNVASNPSNCKGCNNDTEYLSTEPDDTYRSTHVHTIDRWREWCTSRAVQKEKFEKKDNSNEMHQPDLLPTSSQVLLAMMDEILLVSA